MQETSPAAVEIADSIVFQTLDDEIVLLNVTDQGYFGLNPVGAVMWNTLMTCGDVATAAEHVAGHYEVDPITVKRDMQELVGELLAKGLLKPRIEKP